MRSSNLPPSGRGPFVDSEMSESSGSGFWVKATGGWFGSAVLRLRNSKLPPPGRGPGLSVLDLGLDGVDAVGVVCVVACASDILVIALEHGNEESGNDAAEFGSNGMAAANA